MSLQQEALATAVAIPRAARDAERHDATRSHVEAEQLRLQADVGRLTGDLAAARVQRSRRLEYEEKAIEIAQLPSRASLLSDVQKRQEEVDGLKRDIAGAAAREDVRRKQLAALLLAMRELEAGLLEEEEEEEEGGEEQDGDGRGVESSRRAGDAAVSGSSSGAGEGHMQGGGMPGLGGGHGRDPMRARGGRAGQGVGGVGGLPADSLGGVGNGHG